MGRKYAKIEMNTQEMMKEERSRVGEGMWLIVRLRELDG